MRAIQCDADANSSNNTYANADTQAYEAYANTKTSLDRASATAPVVRESELGRDSSNQDVIG